MENAHLFIRPAPQGEPYAKHAKCQFCRLPPVKGVMRLEVPFDAETVRSVDVRICEYCAGGLIHMLNEFIKS